MWKWYKLRIIIERKENMPNSAVKTPFRFRSIVVQQALNSPMAGMKKKRIKMKILR